MKGHNSPDSKTGVFALQGEARFESPAWHSDALRETAARHYAGKEPPIDWDAAKRELRKRAE